MKLFPLNSKAIKKFLKDYGIGVLSCYKGKGTTRNATYITVAFEDAKRFALIAEDLGIVSCTGRKFVIPTKSRSGKWSVEACYMSEAMHNEINA